MGTHPDKISLLLSVIERRQGLDTLVKRGYEYVQIMQMLNDAVAQGYATSDETGVKLTPAGLEKAGLVDRREQRLEKGSWIAPEHESETSPQSRWRVYLPKKKWKAD